MEKTKKEIMDAFSAGYERGFVRGYVKALENMEREAKERARTERMLEFVKKIWKNNRAGEIRLLQNNR